jgi:hypothetical protein
MEEEPLQEIVTKDRIIPMCACGSVELGGKLVPRGSYDEFELIAQGYKFSDGVLSRECCVSQYSSKHLRCLADFKHETCPKPVPLLPDIGAGLKIDLI